MILVYKVVLVVILSTAPNGHEVVLYQMPTWTLCKAKEAELIEGMKGRPGGPITVDCRRDVKVNIGTR